MTTPNRSVPIPAAATQPTARSAIGELFADEDWSGFVRLMRGMDKVAAVVLVGVAFLLALTPARNSDLWVHLASGRALLDGTYHLGHDPFLFTSENGTWVNHNWLLDVGAFLAYRALGGSGLIFLKATLAAILAILLLLLGRVRQVGWHQVFGAALAVLAISPRFSLQPAMVSYLLFALVWLYLEQPIRRSIPAGSTTRFVQFWPVLVLMFLWANLDGWFVLGLLLIAAVAIGEAIRHAVQAGKFRMAPLGLVFAGSVAACLLNPHHVRVLSPPAEIRALWEAPGYPFETLNLAPLQNRFYGTRLAHSAGGVAWFVLAGLSLGALLLNGRNRDSVRQWPVWLVFLALGLAQARAIPFFAIVAGPLLARNLQQFAEGRWGQSFRSDVALRASFSVRVMTFLAFLALPALAWAGWLQPEPYERRNWNVQVDPSLQRTAEEWRQWHRNGAFRADERCWNSSPDVAHYLAWFGHGEKSFLDSRYAAVDQKTRTDYEAVHAALVSGRDEATLFEIFQQRSIRYLIVHDDPEVALRLHQACQHFPESWAAVFQDGSTAIFYWRGGNLPDGSHVPIRTPQLSVWNPSRQAFHPDLSHRGHVAATGAMPRLPDWKSPFVDSPVFSNPDREEAALMVRCFEAERLRQAQQLNIVWKSSLAAGLAVPSGVGTGSAAGVPDTLLRSALVTLEKPSTPDAKFTPAMALALHMGEAQLSGMDEASPAWLFLAIRAARRAVHEQPEDARAWQALGDAYLLLQQKTLERLDFDRWYDFRQLCNAQIIHAWTNAIKLNPNLDGAALNLVNHYRRLDQPELALPLYRRLLERQRAAEPGKGESSQDYAARIRGMTESVKSLEKVVDRDRDLYETNSANLKTEERCALAMQKGLCQTALNTMLEADAASFGRTGLKLEMELLLLAGRAYDVREWLTDEYINVMTELDFHWVKARMYAATGEYTRADEALQRMAEITAGAQGGEQARRAHASLQVTGAVLQALDPNQTPFSSLLDLFARALTFASIREQATYLEQYAEIQVLRGLLALEAGDVALARKCFQTSLGMWVDEESARTGAGIDFNGRRLAQHYLHLIEAAER